jgi:ribonuclease P protein component
MCTRRALPLDSLWITFPLPTLPTEPASAGDKSRRSPANPTRSSTGSPARRRPRRRSLGRVMHSAQRGQQAATTNLSLSHPIRSREIYLHILEIPASNAGRRSLPGSCRLTPPVAVPTIAVLVFPGSADAHEAHLSTQRFEAPTYAWLSCTHGHPQWPQGDQRTSRQRPQTIGVVVARVSSSFPLRGKRLSHSAEFDRVLRFREIQRRRGPCRMYAAANDTDGPRLGLIISKRAVKTAVRRNRLKRLTRESFRASAVALPAVDVVIQMTADASDDELRSILADFWNHLVQRDAAAQRGGPNGP